MIKIFDCHLHTRHSWDSEEPMQTYCRRAVALGIDAICFTDHLDFQEEELGYYKPEAYFAELERAREEFADRLLILAGLEISEPHLHQDELERANRWPYDFILGGMHFWGYPYFNVMDKADYPACCVAYWEAMRAMVSCGGFDALAHLDFPKRYLRCLEYEPQVLDEIFALLIKNNIVLEINTSSLRWGLTEPMPGEALLRQYISHGGRYVTLGSDAHRAADLYAHVPEVRAWAEGFGLESVYFKERKMIRTGNNL